RLYPGVGCFEVGFDVCSVVPVRGGRLLILCSPVHSRSESASTTGTTHDHRARVTFEALAYGEHGVTEQLVHFEGRHQVVAEVVYEGQLGRALLCLYVEARVFQCDCELITDGCEQFGLLPQDCSVPLQTEADGADSFSL